MIHIEYIPAILIQAAIGLVFLAIAYKMLRQKESSYRKAGYGIVLMALGSFIEGLFTLSGFYENVIWIIPETLSVAGILIVALAITRKI